MTKLSDTSRTGRRGVNYIADLVERMGYIWRETPSDDIGIDGEIEIFDGEIPTGKIIKVQSKAGKSYLKNNKSDHFDFYADSNHASYWRSLITPVILVVYDPDLGCAYWVNVKSYLANNPKDESKTLYKISFDKQATAFTVDSAKDLLEMFEPSYKKLEKLYCKHLINQYSKLTLYSVKSDKPLAVELERVFVKLSMTKQEKKERFHLTNHGKKWIFDPNGPDEEKMIPSENLRPDELHEEKQMILSIGEALQQNKRLIIVGAPGAGKTTLLKYLAITFARRLHKVKFDIGEDRIPILLFLRDFSRFLDNQNLKGKLLAYKADLLPQFLCKYYDKAAKQLNLSKEFFNQLLESGKCLVLMDGLDEIADPINRGRITEIVSNITQYYDKNQFLISSRPRGYEGEAKQRLSTHFTDCLIRDFDEDNMSDFTQSWYKAVTYERLSENAAAMREAEIYADDLLGRIKAEPHVKALATNPLLLSILAMVHQRDTTLPQRRAELYDECTQMLLGYWDQIRGGEVGRELAKSGDLDRNEKRALLEPIALWFHKRGEEGQEAEKEDLQKEIARQFVEVMGESSSKANLRAKEFLQIIDERSGLLVEREIGTYGFAHLTFQEYLAARAIADGEKYIDETLKYLHDPWWKEVILLEVGHLSDVSGNLNRARMLTTKLIESIYKANSPYEEILRRDMLFAARAVADVGKLGMSEDLRKEIADALIELWQTTSFKLQKEEYETLFVYAAQTKLGDLLIERLIILTKDANKDVRRTATNALGNLGEAAATEEVLSHLVALTKDTNKDVRRTATNALGRIGEAAATEEVLLHLVVLTKDANKNVRRIATNALGNLGEAATEEILPFLVALTKDANEDVRKNAANTLGRIGEAAATEEVLSHLVVLTKDANEDVRRIATNALGNLGEAATEEILPFLVALTKDTNEDVRKNAAWALGNLGEAAATEEVLLHLVVLTKDANEDVRRIATNALGNLGEAAATEEVLSRLVALTKDTNEDVRKNAAWALGNLGEAAATEEVLLHLVVLTKDANKNVRRIATNALGNLGEAATEEVLPRLVALTKDTSEDVRKNAAWALGNLGEAAATEEVLSHLVVLTKDTSEDVRRNAAWALGNLGEVAATVLPRLMVMIEDTSEDVRIYAADALGKLSIASRETSFAQIFINFWKSKLSDTNFSTLGIERTNDIAYREISRIVSQMPVSFPKT